MTLRRLCFLGSLAALLPVAVVAQTPAPSAPPASPADNLALRFANGVVAVAEDKVITVDDLRREIAPRIPALQRSARNEKEFNEKLEALQDDIVQEMIDRILIVKEFKKDDKRKVPDSFINNAIAEEQIRRFDGDRSKFLAYLRAKGTTLREYRKEVEEDIIYHYMQQQQRKSQSVVSPVRIETFYRENKDRFYQEDSVHLRLIQLSRVDNATDAELKAKAEEIIAKFKAGSKFEDLAQEYSQDSRRSKGGDWGPQKRSGIKEEFAKPLFALKTGEITEPLMLPEGCFILFAEERKYAGNQAIDEVRDQIERMLVTQMARTGQERWLERLRRNGYVKHY